MGVGVGVTPAPGPRVPPARPRVAGEHRPARGVARRGFGRHATDEPRWAELGPLGTLPRARDALVVRTGQARGIAALDLAGVPCLNRLLGEVRGGLPDEPAPA